MAATYATPVSVTAVTNALPAVATATNTFAAGDIVEQTSGWSALTGRAVRVAAPSGTQYSLEGIDTTDTTRYAVGSGVGSARKVLTWAEINQITDVATTGGDQQFYTFGFLAENDDRQIPTTKNPISMTFTVADDPSQPYVALCEAADQDRLPRVLRLNLPGGSSILYNAYITISQTPALTRNQLMTRTITVSLIARPTRYAS
jgi:hypothetical protein